MYKYVAFSGPYFPVFGLNTGKYGPENTYLNIFHAVRGLGARLVGIRRRYETKEVHHL